jgi:hypothetical protein
LEENAVAVLQKVLKERKHRGRSQRPTASSAPRSKSFPRQRKSSDAWDQEEDYEFSSWVQHRDEERIALSVRALLFYCLYLTDIHSKGFIRYIIARKLNRKTPQSALPPSAPPEVAAPTSKSFYLRWNEPESSEFNATAVCIIADEVVEEMPGLTDLMAYNDMFDMVSLHIKYLCTCYRRQTDPATIAKESARRRRVNADTRRRTVSFTACIAKTHIADPATALSPQTSSYRVPAGSNATRTPHRDLGY